MNLKLSTLITILALFGVSNGCKLFRGTRTFPLTYVNNPDPQGFSQGTFNFITQIPITYNSRNKESQNPNYKFRPDIGLNYVAHAAQTESVNWGIDCSGDDRTNCAVTDPTASNYQSYYGYQFYWMPGTTQFTFEGQPPDVKNTPMDIRLINNPSNSSKWQYANTGLLGLSPTSAFWNYVFEQYLPMNDTLGLSYYLTTDTSNYWYELYSGEYDGIFRGSTLRISENIQELLDFDQELEFAESPDNGFWGIKDAKIWISSNMSQPLHEGDACISSTSPNYFISDKFDDIQKMVLKEVCGDTECGPNENILNGPNIYITFNTDKGMKNLTVTPEEYIYYAKSGDIVPSFDDMSAFQKDSCPINSSFGFGRMFMFNRLLIMKLKTDAERTKITPYVGVFDYSTRPSLAKPADVDALVWSGIGTIAFITAVVMFLRSGSSSTVVVKAQKDKTEVKGDDDDEEEKLDLEEDQGEQLGA